jgi:hypothetical protein
MLLTLTQSNHRLTQFALLVSSAKTQEQADPLKRHAWMSSALSRLRLSRESASAALNQEPNP